MDFVLILIDALMLSTISDDRKAELMTRFGTLPPDDQIALTDLLQCLMPKTGTP